LSSLPIPKRFFEYMLISSFVMVDFLKQHMASARLFVVGEETLCAVLRRGGFQLTEQALNIDAVIANFDRNFVYRKL
jgi:ribonucleotide monophosphatase NagD (HAD superfamily)